MIEYFNENLIIKSSINGKINLFKVGNNNYFIYIGSLELDFNLEEIIYTSITDNYIIIAYHEKNINILLLNHQGIILKKYMLPKVFHMLHSYESKKSLFIRCALKYKTHSSFFDYDIFKDKLSHLSTLHMTKVIKKSRQYLLYLFDAQLYLYDFINMCKKSITSFFYNDILHINQDHIIATDDKTLLFLNISTTEIHQLGLSDLSYIQRIEKVSNSEFIIESITNGKIIYRIFNVDLLTLHRFKNINFTINFIYFNNSIQKYICCIENFSNEFQLIVLNSLYEVEFIRLSDSLVIEEYDTYNDRLIYYNKIFKKKTTNKVIIYLHGGPYSRTHNLYNPLFKKILNNNYIIYCLNYYGSTGFGKKYKEKIDKNWLSYDISQVTKFINDLINLNPNIQLSIIGESYGCLLTISLLGGFSKILRNVVLISPIFDLREYLYYKKSKFLNENLHVTTVHQYNKLAKKLPELLNYKLIIVHGGKDTTIPVNQSKDFYESLKESYKRNIYLFTNPSDTHYYFSDSTIKFIISHLK